MGESTITAEHPTGIFHPRVTITEAALPDSETDVRDLFSEYLNWGNAMLRQEYGISLEVAAMLAADMTSLDKFLPPRGCLLLAQLDDRPAGCACLRRIGPQIGEVKRMYVRPAYRGQGIGRALLLALLDRARAAGYLSIRLDSARFMREAHALYKSAGFQEIAPYPESEIPEVYRQHWVFMARALSQPATKSARS